MSRRKVEYPTDVHPEYLAELRRRIETGPGLSVVARAAGMAKGTLWRALNGGAGQRVTADTIERARAGLAYVEDGVAPLPPPVVSIRNAVQYAWLQVGDALLAEDPEVVAAALEEVDAVRQAVRAVGSRRRSRK